MGEGERAACPLRCAMGEELLLDAKKPVPPVEEEAWEPGLRALPSLPAQVEIASF